ncbi:MAG: PriCT-2 domain-containing protein [Lachnospiraceae bacterium]
MEQKTSLLELMEYIHPAELDYQEWVNVGMALKHEGYSVSDWDHWSRQDSGRYHTGECERKWNTFRGNASPVTGGTIFQMAVEHGFIPERGHEIDLRRFHCKRQRPCGSGWKLDRRKGSS